MASRNQKFRRFSWGNGSRAGGGSRSTELAGRWRPRGPSPLSFDSRVPEGARIFTFQKDAAAAATEGRPRTHPLTQARSCLSCAHPLPPKQTPSSQEKFSVCRATDASKVPWLPRVTAQLAPRTAAGKRLKPSRVISSPQLRGGTLPLPQYEGATRWLPGHTRIALPQL